MARDGALDLVPLLFKTINLGLSYLYAALARLLNTTRTEFSSLEHH